MKELITLNPDKLAPFIHENGLLVSSRLIDDNGTPMDLQTRLYYLIQGLQPSDQMFIKHQKTYEYSQGGPMIIQHFTDSSATQSEFAPTLKLSRYMAVESILPFDNHKDDV